MEASRCVVGCTVFDVALWQIPLRLPHPTLRRRQPIRLDTKRARKTRYMARLPEKQAKRDALSNMLREWCIESFLLTCPPAERVMRLLWEEYYPTSEDEDEPTRPDQ